MHSENGILLLFYIFLSHRNEEKKKKKIKKGGVGCKKEGCCVLSTSTCRGVAGCKTMCNQRTSARDLGAA